MNPLLPDSNIKFPDILQKEKKNQNPKQKEK